MVTGSPTCPRGVPAAPPTPLRTHTTFVQPNGQILHWRSSYRKHTLIKSSRSTKWYVPCFTNCLFTPQQRYFTSTTSKIADRCDRQTQDCPAVGKCATRTPRTFLTTSTNHRKYHDGSLRQEPIPRNSRLSWLSTTARLRSDPKLGD